jgi:SAM-dependent methyltransferase
LVLKLSGKCKRVAGVDLSDRMIAYARKQKARMAATNVTFVCEDASKTGTILDERFSLATVCFCLHGMSSNVRRDVIGNCFVLSQKVILADFVSAFPKSIVGAAQILIEAIEGRKSYR